MYTALPLNQLLVGHPVNFDLYVHYASGHTTVFSTAGMQFSQEKLSELHSNNVDCLYIRSEDEDKLLDYHARIMHLLLSNSKMTSEERAELLHASMHDHMQQLFDEGISPQAIKRTRSFVGAMVNEIVSSRIHTETLLRLTSRDFKVYSHCVNVSIYSIAIGQAMGFEAERLVRLGTGAMLHDIGMLKIDDSIIEKADRLSTEEFKAIRNHPELGCEMLKAMGERDPLILDIIHYHHEKLDGSGYGEGLTAAQISLDVQIVTVADIFDAISTNRSFKKAKSSFQSFSMIKMLMKEQLDIRIVDKLIMQMGGHQADRAFVADSGRAM
jgi:putative nucleotidyltransferase with HDIG domain